MLLSELLPHPSLVWFAASALLAAQPQTRIIHGIVVDSAGNPVPFANVATVGGPRQAVAGPDGRFRLAMDNSAKLTFEVRRIGYHPLTLKLDQWPDSAIRIVMTEAARTLELQTIIAERTRALALHGFYERMADVERGIDHGFFITPEELAARPGARVTDFLRGRPAVRVTLVSADPFGRGRKGWQPQGIDGCRMEIYVDGVRFYTLMGKGGGEYVEDLIQPNSIAGIEVYPRSVTAPPKYQSLNGRCGVILIWTK